MAPNPGGPPLWTGLALEDIKALIKFSAAELGRCHDERAKLNAEKYQFSRAVELEIEFWERTHDLHWQILRERTNDSQKSGSPS